MSGAPREESLAEMKLDTIGEGECCGTCNTYNAPWAKETNEKGLVSVILVNHNGLKFFEGFFQSLFEQTYSPLEVLFFDNGSTDDSVEYVKNFPSVEVFELRQNMGFSVPNNLGIRRSRGQYVLTLNLDVILEKNFIEELVKAIELDPHIGWVAGKMLKLTPGGAKTEEIDCLGHHFHRDRYAKETDYSRPFQWSYYSKQRYVFGASACAALYKRAMLHDIAINGEYFDEDFVSYWEDVDLDWRAQLMSWKCLYTPAAVGHHVRGGSGLYRRPEIAANYLANHFLMLLKNDELMHLLQDMAPFMIRLQRDLISFLKDNPRSIPLALKMILKKTPRTILKRRIIQRKRRVTSSYMRSLIR